MKRQDDNDNNCKKIQTRVSESVKITCDPQPGQFNCKTQANQRSPAIPPDAHFKSIQFWRGGSVFLAFKNEKRKKEREQFFALGSKKIASKIPTKQSLSRVLMGNQTPEEESTF